MVQANKKKKIIWFAVARSPYNDFLFNQLHYHYNLYVYYKIKKLSSHPWQLSNVKYYYYFITDNFISVLRLINHADLVVVSGWGYWRYALIILLLKKKVKKVYWTDSLNPKGNYWKGYKGVLRKAISKYVFKYFDQIWSTGKMGLQALVDLGCNINKIRSFPFFYDLSRFNNISNEKIIKAKEVRTKYIKNKDTIIFLCMGQIIKKKRFADIIKAISRINSKKCVLLIAGKGNKEYELKFLTDNLKLNDSVYFLGWLQPNEVEILFLSADVFIHPSERDPFPTVVLDAMTWGKPIIGTNVSGSVVDRVENGKNGFVYEVGNIKKLAEYMTYFINNKYKIHEFGEEARKKACEYPVSYGIEIINSIIKS